jgi:metallo-beta-lactamase family protein
MRIHLCGAAGEVTGSGYLVQTDRARVLVDFGMFQGPEATDARNRDLGPVDPATIDAVVLTHAHIDHCGRLPLLTLAGYARAIHCTPATAEFTELLLRDSANIQESDAERTNRRLARAGDPLIEPLYRREDVESVLPLFRPLPYGQWREIADGIRVRLVDAGHVLGSSSVEMQVTEGGSTRTIVFSGDVGPSGVPLMHDPTLFTSADLVFMESTYGDRDHRALAETVNELKSALTRSAWEKEKVLIPSFAVGRTQLILYYMAELRRDREIPEAPIFLDSPMAVKATELYIKHLELLDDQTRAMARDGVFRRELANLKFVQSAEESKALNSSWDPCIVIAASGMCEGGRIVHHLKHNLWRKGVVILIAGYQAYGTLGRRLVDGAPYVRIHGDTVRVRATISTLGGFSAHAGQTDLLRWFGSLAPSSPRLVLTHGEDMPRAALAAKLKERFNAVAELPARGAFIDF